MKILIDYFGPPFFLAHGGAHTQVVETVNGLRDLGVEVEFARWWDGKQCPDLIHSFGVPNLSYQSYAKSKGIPVINTNLFTATCNRTTLQLNLQGLMLATLLKMPRIPPWGGIRSQLNWEAFKTCELNIVGLEAEVRVLKGVYGVPRDRITTLPLGLASPFLRAGHGSRESDYLITTGTITERKRSLELARMAHIAKVPICFVGKPYDPTGSYWRKFQGLVDNKFVRHIPHTDSVEQMIHLLQGARGFVLYSDYENWCLSAHEAIACGLPILVPDQPWSRELFGSESRYFPGRNETTNAGIISLFHRECPMLAPPKIQLFSWREVANSLIKIYKKTLA